MERTLPLLRPVPLHDDVPLTDDVTVTLRSAGHILGASTALVEAGGARVLFSGDLGRPDHPLLARREDPPASDVIVVESTYGDRRHPPPVDATDHILGDVIRRTVGRGGTVLIPAFAIDRTELVLLRLGELMAAGVVPVVPVYLDSPMAGRALDVYRRALSDVDPRLLPASWNVRTFGVPDLHIVRDAAESVALNTPQEPCIILSASGMATGGRVVHHLSHQLGDPRNAVVLVGYQAPGTRGRDLVDGARQVKMHGRYVPVRAEVVEDPQFSVHADSDEILEWVSRSPTQPRVLYAVHGEPAGVRGPDRAGRP